LTIGPPAAERLKEFFRFKNYKEGAKRHPKFSQTGRHWNSDCFQKYGLFYRAHRQGATSGTLIQINSEGVSDIEIKYQRQTQGCLGSPD
jgi:hypothetical protein